MTVTRVLRPLQRFVRLEAAGGLVLLVASIAALVWANVGAQSYADVWSHTIDIAWGPVEFDEDLAHVVNDGLMALFFLVVGLEVKRELTVGELSTRSAALLPLFAALGGMLLPALIFLGVMGGQPGSNGWGIPMATDVAFALAALTALRSRVPAALVAFLLGVAVIDDVGAILVIAVAYGKALAPGWLVGAALLIAALPLLRRAGLRSPVVFVLLGIVAWYMTYRSGVHATIAGVALGLVTPVHARPEDGPDAPSPLERLEDALHGWSSFVVLPLFALANAGIPLGSEAIDAATDSPVTLAVVLGLVVGKTLGLTAGALVATRTGVARLPDGTGWGHMLGVGALAGIGFTVSLFIAELAFEGTAREEAAKLGILIGSVVAAALGLSLLAVVTRRRLSP